jgi:endonuclease/exonuclease/phosphatase family metal-dependent hydrolase
MRRIAPLILAVLMTATLATPATADYVQADRLRVMTQNLYVGTDLFELLEPVTDCEPYDAAGVPCSLIVQGGKALDDVAATDYPERAKKIADLISWRRPDVIGLQEVSRITVVPTDPTGNPVAPPEVTDYLDILLAELAARGLDYQVAASVDNADIFPVPTGVFVPGLGPVVENLVGLLDRDVILARDGVTVHADTVDSARYQTAQLSFPLGGDEVEFTRSYVKVDLTVRGRRYAAVNTHLEVEFESGSPLYPVANQIQAAQAGELVGALAAEDDPVVLLGDFNSAPDSDNGLPLPTPYQILAGNGFTDVWNVRTFGSGPGFTCCQAELLDNPVSQLDQRIDQIWLGLGIDVRWAFANTVGDRYWQKTPAGLWPSDHAGVMAYLGLEP